MGREWLHWVSGGASRRRRSISAEGTTSAGCMCAVFHLFDLNQFQLPLNHQNSLHPFLQQPEAPRNSLEMEESDAMKAPSKPLQQEEEEENLNFTVGININQIKTRVSTSSSKSRTEELTDVNSPGTKTPSLVARLMGLDLLPECSSPSSNSNPQSKSRLYQKRSNRCFSDDDISVGARSLPETPRTSSSRRSDVDHHHRLSLQINKERINDGKRARLFRKVQDENSNNSSPGHYAKQIVKQVKESVSRRVGLMDITNTNRDEHRRDQNLLIKLHKKSPKLEGENSPDFKQSTAQSCSPKLRFFDAKKCKSVTETEIKSPRNSSPQVIIQEQQNDCKKVCSVKKLNNQSFDKGMRSKKEEAYVRTAAKKSKKPPLSSELLHISGPTLLPVKKDPSPPATKLPQKQVSSADSLSSKRNTQTQLSCNTSHSYKPDKISTVLPDKTNGCAAAPDYKPYVNNILKRAGIVDKFTPLTLGKWHTPSHPLDPSIFYYLELFHPAAAALSRRCNRKLIFQLVDELLADILRPRLEFKYNNNGDFALDDELCKRIESFPAANCRVLEDIDCLVDNDLCMTPLSGSYRDEEERLVCEIEGEIVEWLVRETVSLVGVRTDVTWEFT